ncbi:DMT family transporter [Deinococcus humi]|uniref:Drug/metabolite transporter (DMT)-like permease n=1 Tax=Deinococcus humi TaxID=662880 RepID=A0A7W8JSE7_9DEIO|nr:DMT family transporter [Deinococcus humi]MBB5362382.1 drug/metabolite transporter (DMT)-like permease [Deinococcus humi]GGO29076.1 membrane protein [Deinococcus humi]
MSGVTLGLLAALAWGFADYLAQPASRRMGAMRASFAAQGFGVAALLAYLLLSGQHLFPTDAVAWVWALGASTLMTAGGLAFYQSLGLGQLAVVAPIMGSYGAVTTALAWLSGERLSLLTGLSLLGVLVSVVLVSLPQKTEGFESTPAQLRGAWWAICSAVTLGTCFFVIGYGLTPRVGGVQATWILRLCTLVLTFVTLRIWQGRRTGMRPADGPGALKYAGWSGLLSTGAILVTALGLGRGEDSVVTVLGSMSIVLTTLLALFLNRERLGAVQWAGVALACLSTALVGLR